MTAEYVSVFLTGALGYGALELIYRGSTHWTMLLTGGICFVAIYIIANFGAMNLIKQCLLCAAIITAIELIVGIIVNIGLGWDVWDYSANPYNLKGQICLSFSAAWLILSVPATYLCRLIRKIFISAKKRALR